MRRCATSNPIQQTELELRYQIVMQRIHILLRSLVLCAALCLLGGCRSTAEKMREKIRFEGVEAVRPIGLTGLELDTRVVNDSAHNLSLEDVTLLFYYQTSRLATIQLVEPLTLKRRTTAVLTSRWSVKVANPIALLAAGRALKQGDLSKLPVSLQATGRGGPVGVNIERDRIAMSEFLSIFGLEADQLTQMIP